MDSDSGAMRIPSSSTPGKKRMKADAVTIVYHWSEKKRNLLDNNNNSAPRQHFPFGDRNSRELDVATRKNDTDGFGIIRQMQNRQRINIVPVDPFMRRSALPHGPRARGNTCRFQNISRGSAVRSEVGIIQRKAYPKGTGVVL